MAIHRTHTDGPRPDRITHWLQTLALDRRVACFSVAPAPQDHQRPGLRFACVVSGTRTIVAEAELTLQLMLRESRSLSSAPYLVPLLLVPRGVRSVLLGLYRHTPLTFCPLQEGPVAPRRRHGKPSRREAPCDTPLATPALLPRRTFA
ncbi:hypothetical protein Z043_111280 [Scleropages formosus]|uniref:Uncharacterized protein n=1 Tax=Scleropages formosus TaxID=113540 RepID=A0A0N8JZP7_SCLFO|nr:hypothetical protein Z043_111280 [Scleropages formosus]